VLNLACQFFTVYLILWMFITLREHAGTEFKMLKESVESSRATVQFCPMLAILFVGALQLSNNRGAPQGWAQDGFYMMSCAILIQTCLSVAVPLVTQGEVQSAREFQGADGDMKYTVTNPTLGLVLTVCRYIVMFFILVGVTAVCTSVFLIEHPNGAQYTPAVSPTMQCVLNLACQFFTVYLILWMFITLRGHTGTEFKMLKESVESARATVQFCPMRAILFVGTQMRALQLSNNRGAPQGWAQDGMSVSLTVVVHAVLPTFLRQLRDRTRFNEVIGNAAMLGSGYFLIVALIGYFYFGDSRCPV